MSGSEVTVTDIAAYLEKNDNIVKAGSEYQTVDAYQELGLKSDSFFGKRLHTQYPSNPDFSVTNGLLANGAKFDYPHFREALRVDHFDKTVSFRGAFGNQTGRTVGPILTRLMRSIKRLGLNIN